MWWTMPEKGGDPERQPGFYNGQFDPEELQDLEASLVGNLENEVKMLRVHIRRVLEKANQAETFEESIKALSALGLAASRLARMLKTQQSLGKSAQNFDEGIMKVLGEFIEEQEIRRRGGASGSAGRQLEMHFGNKDTNG
jgi:hypothetical protein